jgi:hypothetical protein
MAAQQWYEELLVKYPQMQPTYRDVPDGQNGFLQFLLYLESSGLVSPPQATGSTALGFHSITVASTTALNEDPRKSISTAVGLWFSNTPNSHVTLAKTAKRNLGKVL